MARAVYVVVDMEGISGIVNIQQVSLGEPAYAEGRQLLAGDVNAAVAGAFDGGADRVVVCDFHDSRRNFPIADMDPRAEYEVPHGSKMPALDRWFDSLVVVGMHAKSGTPRAFLEHSFEPTWHRYWIDGNEHGELAVLAFLAGSFGVPTVFVSGDRAAIDEARTLIPAVEGVSVKEGLARDWCRTLAPSRAHELIRTGVSRALMREDRADPVALRFPVSVRLELNRCSDADAYEGYSGVTRKDGFTIEWVASSAAELTPN